MIRLLRALIDSAALRHNLGTIRAYAPGAKVMAVVKANAYGHGLLSTAAALADADALAVARLEEGIALRSTGVNTPIVLLEGVFSAEQLGEAAHHRFELVVHDPLQLELLEAHRGAERFVIWIKMDTGMNRLGFRPEAFAPALARLRAMSVPALELRAMTHLARADERSEPMTLEQVGRFESTLASAGLTGAHRLATSIGNSAGTLGHPRAHGDWVRPGLALYGVSPFADATGATHGLKPVMTLETTVLTVREVKRGETVGYAGSVACRARQLHRHSRGGLRRRPSASSRQRHAGADRRFPVSAGGARVDGHDRRERQRRAESRHRQQGRHLGRGPAGRRRRNACRHDSV